MTRLAAAVAQAADQLRAANHATVRGSITATEAYDVVGNLDDLAHRLPQLLDYLTRALRRADAGEYVDDRGKDPSRTLSRTNDHLDGARRGAGELAEHVTAVHNELGHLGQLTPED